MVNTMYHSILSYVLEKHPVLQVVLKTILSLRIGTKISYVRKQTDGKFCRLILSSLIYIQISMVKQRVRFNSNNCTWILTWYVVAYGKLYKLTTP